MAKSSKEKKNKENESKEERWRNSLGEDTRRSIGAIIALLLAVFFVLAAAGKAGIIGDAIYRFLKLLFGGAFFLLPAVFGLVAFSAFFSLRRRLVANTVVGGALFFLSALGLAELLFADGTGGLIGAYVEAPLVRLFDTWATALLLAAFLLVGAMIMFNFSLRVPAWLSLRLKKAPAEALPEDTHNNVPEDVSAPQPYEETTTEDTPDPSTSADEDGEEHKTSPQPEQGTAAVSAFATRTTRAFGAVRHKKTDTAFQSPPLNLLEGDAGKPSSGDIKANANVIKRTLQNFGIDVEMGEVNVGPSVTQYTLKPAEGMKLSRISALQNDLALALAAHPLRLEAPIPGRSLVGIEIPNRTVAMVGLRGLLGHEEFTQSTKPMLFALGKDVTGKAVFAHLAAMPHLLIAGSTGSGKSINIHVILMSLLYRNSPERLRLIIVDPKRVELSLYKTIPHLLTPVITDAKKAILALRWATKEMERRYLQLSEAGVRDIHSYHVQLAKRAADASEEEAMPYIVVVIDELADIMSVYPRELEAVIVRLAQMSRAVGIHLIVSTQRPSVEVITGLIKANITSRIAFQVASQVDSRTVIDRAGAERLLGNGDMLFVAGDSGKPRRIQGAFVTEREIKRVVEYVASEYDPPFLDVDFTEHKGRDSDDGGGTEEDEDELYEEARTLVIEAKKASASFLQRRLRVGYARAARLLDLLEERDVIGPGDGAKPREVLVQKDEFGSTEGRYAGQDTTDDALM